VPRGARGGSAGHGWNVHPIASFHPYGFAAQVVQDAQQWLAQQLSVAVEQVQLVEVEQGRVDRVLAWAWVSQNESCLQAMTPGWRVIFEINGQPLRGPYRSDRFRYPPGYPVRLFKRGEMNEKSPRKGRGTQHATLSQ